MKSARTKACDITKKVKDRVWERDNQCCILCGSHYAMPNAHYIPRSKGGLGVERDVVTLCMTCHRLFDESSKRAEYGKTIREYLMNCYPDWDEEKLIFRKE